MKRFLVFLVLFCALSLLGAKEAQEATALHYSSSIFLSHLGVAKEAGRTEYDLTFSTAFPNMIPIGWIPGDGTDENGEVSAYSWRQFGHDALSSLSLLGLLHGDYRYNLVSSGLHRLDVGGGVVLGAMNLDWEAAILIAFLETNIRYTRSFQNGDGLFLSLELPLLGYLANVSSDGYYGELYVSPLDPRIPLVYGFFAGLSLGYRLAL